MTDESLISCVGHCFVLASLMGSTFDCEGKKCKIIPFIITSKNGLLILQNCANFIAPGIIQAFVVFVVVVVVVVVGVTCII